VEIHLPRAKAPPQDKKLSFAAVAARWFVPTWIAQYELEKAGLEIVDVERKPLRGVKFTDLLALEERVRRGKSSLQERRGGKTPKLEVVR